MPTQITISKGIGTPVNPHQLPENYTGLSSGQAMNEFMYKEFQAHHNTGHPCPELSDTKPGETVQAELINQRCENPEDKWPDGNWTRQIWRLKAGDRLLNSKNHESRA